MPIHISKTNTAMGIKIAFKCLFVDGVGVGVGVGRTLKGFGPYGKM